MAMRAAFALTFLLLAGCGGMPGLPLPASDSPAEVTGGVEGEASPSPEAIAAENPYFDSRRRVDDAARQRFAAATAAMAAGDWTTARADLEWLVDQHPKLSGPYLNLGLLHAANGNLAEAERYFEATLDVNPRNLEAYNQYAIFLRRQGRFDDAEQVYRSALGVWADHAATHRNLGVLYDLYRGEREKALQHYYRYQDLTGGEDRAVAGWIIDLERQFNSVARRGDR
jgi:Flp pilus assembly protein TadD